jgi:hypothetical protein
MIIGMSITKFLFFMPIGNPRWPPSQDIDITLDPMGKCSNAFFSETTNMIKAKLYMNVHWTVLYNLKVFCSDMKFKMAAPSWISDRHKKQKLGKGHSNDHSFTVWVQSVH